MTTSTWRIVCVCVQLHGLSSESNFVSVSCDYSNLIGSTRFGVKHTKCIAIMSVTGVIIPVQAIAAVKTRVINSPPRLSSQYGIILQGRIYH